MLVYVPEKGTYDDVVCWLTVLRPLGRVEIQVKQQLAEICEQCDGNKSPYPP